MTIEQKEALHDRMRKLPNKELRDIMEMAEGILIVRGIVKSQKAAHKKGLATLEIKEEK